MFTYIFHILQFPGIISFPKITRKQSEFPRIQEIFLKVETLVSCASFNVHECLLTRSIRDSETSIDFVQGPPGSRRERVNGFIKAT